MQLQGRPPPSFLSAIAGHVYIARELLSQVSDLLDGLGPATGIAVSLDFAAGDFIAGPRW